MYWLCVHTNIHLHVTKSAHPEFAGGFVKEFISRNNNFEFVCIRHSYCLHHPIHTYLHSHIFTMYRSNKWNPCIPYKYRCVFFFVLLSVVYQSECMFWDESVKWIHWNILGLFVFVTIVWYMKDDNKIIELSSVGFSLYYIHFYRTCSISKARCLSLIAIKLSKHISFAWIFFGFFCVDWALNCWFGFINYKLFN